MEDRFALLIDADNVSAKYIKPILDELSKYGNVTYKRIYGDWTKSNSASWKEELLQNSITPIQQFSYTQGKNSTDSAMIIDAMDMLYTSELEGFCLVSSDSDFTKLASRLRESGKMVIGMGEDKTPLPFRKACDIFTVLEVLLEDNTIEKEESEGKSYHPHVFGRGQKKISGASLSSSNGRGSKEKKKSWLRSLRKTRITTGKPGLVKLEAGWSKYIRTLMFDVMVTVCYPSSLKLYRN